MYVKPPPHQCLFIYVNLSQRVPAVTSMSVSFRFLKPMIFNTTAQWSNRQATASMLALGPRVLQGLSLCQPRAVMAVMDASVSLIVRRANRIDLRAWQLGRTDSMEKRRHVPDGGLVGSLSSDSWWCTMWSWQREPLSSGTAHQLSYHFDIKVITTFFSSIFIVLLVTVLVD